MQKRLLNEAEAYAKRNHRRQVWRKLVRMMACVVVFCTTYALILPAITMERSQCELEEHIHSESCYAKVTTRQQQTLSCTYDSLSVHQHTPECRDGEGALICGYGDYLVHEHDAACTDEAGILVCQLPVVKAHTHTEEDCFAPVEMETEHIHDDTCYTLQRGELLCQIEETPGHAHGDECYTLGELQCQLEEREGHTHTETCTEKILLCDLTVEPHVHTDACYRQLTCDLSTEPAHTHTDACTGRTLTCTSEEEGHEHTDACYLQLTCDLSTEPLHTHTDACTGRVLDCQQTEQPHIHTDECYQVNDLCGQEEQEGHTHTRACYASELTCEEEETEGHAHTDECYEQLRAQICDPVPAEPELELICEKPEVVLHTHTDACYETYLDEAGAEQRRLICPELEVRTHTHGESCYITQEIPMEDVDTLTCQVDEAHRHTEQCYDETGALTCQHPEDHTHGERCYGTWELICGKEEHTHSAECTALLGLPEEERLAVEEVIALIEPLPTYDDMMAKLDEFYEADDMEGEEAYMMEVYAQVEEAYRAYMALPEELREYVTNADKLMELEFIWSRITLEEATAAAREDDLAVVAGGGITFKLFNYSEHINKNSDHTAWRAIKPYFNFRNSVQAASAIGSDPTVHNTDNSQNTAHDQDGFTKTHATVERKLDGNRNPVLDLTRNADGSARTDPGVSAETRSLAYLFSNTGDHAVTAYSPSNTILQKSGNHYYYNSANNAVDFDIPNNVFRVRSYAERNSSTAGYSGYSDFTPFTYTDGKVVGTNTKTSIDYHVLNTDVDYWFGMTMDVNFFQTKDGQIDGGDMIFSFSGDDDVWVFVDDVLVLDLGGTHGTATGSINFATGEVVQYLSWSGGTEESETTSFPTTIRKCFDAAGATPNGGWDESGETLADYTEHTLKFFYMERGAAVANCKLDFRLPTLPDKSLTVTKDLVADGNAAVTDFIADTLSYKFRVVKTDAEGNATNDLFIQPGVTYTILDGGTAAGRGTVDADGYFTLKAGQSAQFTDMLVKGGGAKEYIVQEVMPDDLTGQYGGVEYAVSGTTGSIEKETGDIESFATFSTDVLSAESTQTVTYRNKVNTSALSVMKVTKEKAAAAEFGADEVFQIQVRLGDQLLPVGSEYQIEGTDTVKTVTTAGIVELKIGQTANILEGILSGTTYEVTELGTEAGGFNASYSGTVSPSGEVTCTPDGATGEFPLNSLVHVTVTNANYDFAGEIPLSKEAIDNTGAATFNFIVQNASRNEDSSWTIGDQIPGTNITVNGANKNSGVVTIGYKAGTEGTFYYKISEQKGTGDFIYDDTFYIVEVNVSKEGADGKGTATVGTIWKNGIEEVNAIAFVNRKTTKLYVTKEIEGIVAPSGAKFPFEVTIMLDGQLFATKTFELEHGGRIEIAGIPYDAVVTVKETNFDGYVAYHKIDDEHTERVLGNEAQLTFTNVPRTMHFINNAGYELPNTGGAGTYLYTTGALLIMAMAILLYIHNLRRRKEETPSF